MEIGNRIFIEQMSAYMIKADESGILTKFLSCFGYDWGTFLKPLIEDQTSIHNPEESEDLLSQIMGLSENELLISNTKFLKLIGYDIGSPIDVTKTPNPNETMYNPTGGNEEYPGIYRKILTLIISLYKWRGTALAIKFWGYIIGFDVELVTIKRPKVSYDMGFTYDSDINTSEVTKEVISYDMGTCESCTQFYIRVNNSIYSGKKY